MPPSADAPGQFALETAVLRSMGKMRQTSNRGYDQKNKRDLDAEIEQHAIENGGSVRLRLSRRHRRVRMRERRLSDTDQHDDRQNSQNAHDRLASFPWSVVRRCDRASGSNAAPANR